MSYPAYDSYKDSGIEWLRNLPSQWKHSKLYLLSRRYAGGTPDKSVAEYWEDGTIPWLNSGAVNQFNITEPSAYISETAFKNSSTKWVPEYGLLVALAGQGKTKGMVAQTTFDTTCNQSMAAIVCERIFPRFMLWWLTANYKKIRGMASNEARDGLNLEMIGSIPCPLPSDLEQEAIAKFLDEKTMAIDALIAKKEKLLELLAEKRIALITRAVTKGLDPTAPMKPSSIDWFGEIPKEWEAIKLRFLCKINTGSRDTENRISDAEYPFFVRSQTIELIDSYALDCEAVLTAGDGVGVGKVFHYYNGKFDFHQRVYAFTDFNKIRGKFFFQFFSQFFGLQMNIYSAKSTVDSVRRPFLQELIMCVPPEEEQKEIVEFLEEEIVKFDKMEKAVRAAISKLKEYRIGIITNAVTGKIRVT